MGNLFLNMYLKLSHFWRMTAAQNWTHCIFCESKHVLCLPSLHREKAARVNWHQPTARPGWAPTCEEDVLFKVCMLTLRAPVADSRGRITQRITRLITNTNSITPAQDGSDTKCKDFNVLKWSLLFHWDDAGKNSFVSLYIWRSEVFWWKLKPHLSCTLLVGDALCSAYTMEASLTETMF